MRKIDSETGLRDAILQLEIQRANEGKILKEQFYLAVDSVKPINLIKNTFKEAIATRDLKYDIVNTSVGLTAGYLSKIVFSSVLKTPLTKFLGTALMFGITNLVARNPETVKSLGKGFIKMIRSKPTGKAKELSNTEPRQIAP
jgi:hypothetical protein